MRKKHTWSQTEWCCRVVAKVRKISFLPGLPGKGGAPPPSPAGREGLAFPGLPDLPGRLPGDVPGYTPIRYNPPPSEPKSGLMKGGVTTTWILRKKHD